MEINGMNGYELTGKRFYDSMTVDERIAITAYLFHAIANHDGTYRRLIYETLGLPVEGGTYSKLYPDGMVISNAMVAANEDGCHG